MAGAPCAQQGLSVSAAEVQTIVSGMSGASLSSLVLNGKKYMLLRSDEEALHARAGPSPASVYKTNTLLLVGIGGDGASAEKLSVGLSKVAAMLKENGL